jgi:hypothetical protein
MGVKQQIEFARDTGHEYNRGNTMLRQALQRTDQRLHAPDRNSIDIIVWWEVRRILYNLIVGVWGAICLLIFIWSVNASGHVAPGEDAIEPLILLFLPFAVNVCYTIGWPAEIVLRKLRPELGPTVGKLLFRAGSIFSLLLISLPALIWSVVWLIS